MSLLNGYVVLRVRKSSRSPLWERVRKSSHRHNWF